MFLKDRKNVKYKITKKQLIIERLSVKISIQKSLYNLIFLVESKFLKMLTV